MKKFVLPLAAVAMAAPAHSATIITFYGDDDGFGIGTTSGSIDPTVSNADPGDADGTDTRLIGAGFLAPGFTPTGGFDPFSVTGTITSAILTIRFGGFDSGPNPVDGPNQLFLDGLEVSPAFLSGFNSANTDLVETQSFALDSSFFSLLSDGAVSLAGTTISEDSGSGSFQIDFLSLEITTDMGAVPEPATWAFMIIGFGAIGGAMRRQRKANVKVSYA